MKDQQRCYPQRDVAAAALQFFFDIVIRSSIAGRKICPQADEQQIRIFEADPNSVRWRRNLVIDRRGITDGNVISLSAGNAQGEAMKQGGMRQIMGRSDHVPKHGRKIFPSGPNCRRFLILRASGS